MKYLLLKGVTTSIVLFFVNAVSVDANWSPWDNRITDQAVSLNEFQSFWVDAIDVVSNLDSYEKLWIKPHSCVWSECAVDDTDDNYMGDNRDGDEQWYQYRTQGFCANAAYSLYGQRKDDKFFSSFLGCTRRHFINSFFTYGGADNLLKSIGVSPNVYAYDDGGNGDNDDNEELSANTACVEIEYDGSDDISNYYDGNNDGGSDDNANSNSGSNDNDEYSGTLGCAADGKYIIAAFQSSSCDGNYYAGIVNDFKDYNEQHNAIGCHKIYENDGEISVENVMTLLNNSWSCDLRLYPNGCPDPYGSKEKFDFAIRTVAHGGNPHRAYQNMMLKTPLHVASWTLLAMTILVFVITYLVKNESRAILSKGGNNFMGYLRCIKEDVTIGSYKFGAQTTLHWHAFVAKLTKNKSKQENESSIKKEFSDESNVDSDGYGNSTGIYVHAEDAGEKKLEMAGEKMLDEMSLHHLEPQTPHTNWTSL